MRRIGERRKGTHVTYRPVKARSRWISRAYNMLERKGYTRVYGKNEDLYEEEFRIHTSHDGHPWIEWCEPRTNWFDSYR